MDSVDPYNIKRGRCINDCDCLGYIRFDNKIVCAYCDCPPAKHIRIIEDPLSIEEIDQIDLSVAAEVITPEILIEDPQIAQNVNGTEEIPTNNAPINRVEIVEQNNGEEASKNQEILHPVILKNVDACFPPVWPDYIQEIIEGKKNLTSTIRCEIVRTLVKLMTSRKMTDNSHFIDVAEEALIRIPALKTQSAQSSAVLVKEMKKCLKNKTQYDKKRTTKLVETENTNLTHDEIKTNMAKEMLKEKPSINTLKRDLEACRIKRREEARKSASALDHLKQYPALNKPELIQFEFEAEIGWTKEEVKNHWITALIHLKNYFLKDVTNTDSLTNDQMTIQILAAVTKYFKPRRIAASSTTKDIVQIFDAQTTISTTVPKADEPPRLIGIGSNDLPNLQFSIYVDQHIMFSGTAIEALYQMFALYWIFNIDYPGDARMAFTFVSAILFEKKVSNQFIKYKTVFNVLEELKLF